MPETRIINPTEPEPSIIREAAEIIQQGGLVVFPTRCLYGLGANPFDTNAIARIFQIKQRETQKPILILINSQSELESVVAHIPFAAAQIMARYWPGKITLVLKATDRLPSELTAGTGKIGVRWCQHPVASALIAAAGSPITGTSANLSGNPGCARISELDKEIASQADLILDAGELAGGAGSTVADISQELPVILREGVISAKEILAMFDKIGQ